MATISHSIRRDEEVVRAAVPRVPPPAPSRFQTILLVEDENVCRLTTRWFLANFGYTVVPARSAEEALALFAPEIHDVVVTDHEMAALSGAEMAHIIKLRSPTTPVIMYTGRPPADRSCLDAVIQKPAHLLTLKAAIEAALAARPAATGSRYSGCQPESPNR